MIASESGYGESMPKNRKRKQNKMPFSYFLINDLKDLGLVYVVFFISALVHGADGVLIWTSMCLLLFLGILFNAISKYRRYLKTEVKNS